MRQVPSARVTLAPLQVNTGLAGLAMVVLQERRNPKIAADIIEEPNKSYNSRFIKCGVR